MDRQVMAMPYAPITADLNKPLDVEIYFLPEFPLNPICPIDELTDTVNLLFSKLPHLGIGIDPGVREDLSAQGGSDAIDILQGGLNPLVFRNIYSGNTCQMPSLFELALPLLMPWIRADNPDYPVASYYLTLFASTLHRSLHLHNNPSFADSQSRIY